MGAENFAELLQLVRALSKRQRDKLRRFLDQFKDGDQVVELVENAAAPVLACPRCRAGKWHRHGHAGGLQRYRCRECGMTGTPLAHLRHRDKWMTYMDCLLGTLTVRQAAAEIRVDKNTTFRWRHRFLALPKMDRRLSLHGITEADEMYLLESQKGARHLDRPARRRGGVARKRGISDEQVCILVARERSGNTLDFVTGCGPVTKMQLQRCLGPLIASDALLVTDSNAAYRYFAKEAQISHETVNLRAGIRTRGAFHVQNVNAYHSRFRNWLRGFNGVATHYLPNYLGWRWALDQDRVCDPEALLRLAVGDFNN
jgi:transposase-like protein